MKIKAELDLFGSNNVPYKIKINQKGINFDIQKTYVLEYIEDKITNDKLTLDGKEIKTEVMRQQATMNANLPEKSDTLYLNSKTILNWSDKPFEMDICEKWTLSDNAKTLSIDSNVQHTSGK